MAVATLGELKKQLNRTDNHDDVELQLYLDAATGVVESVIDGPTEVTTFTERQTVGDTGVVAPRRRPIVSVTSLTLKGSSAPVDPDRYTIDSGVIYLDQVARGTYTLVYEAGYTTLPATYKLAGLIIAEHLWNTQNGGGGRVLPGDDTVMVPGVAYAIPNRALELLTGGMLPAVG